MPSSRRLVVEVGNSRWKAGLFADDRSADDGSADDGRGRRPPEPVATLRVTHAEDPAAPLRAFLEEHASDGVTAPAVWAGVNPAGAAALLAAWPPDYGPPPIELPRAALDRLIENRTRQPERVGTDRLLNALAAAVLAPLVADNDDDDIPAFAAVADCGTATTVDMVGLNADGPPAFLGGAILPGAVLCVKALHAHTALLPEVSLEGDAPADGRDTAAAIRLGVLEMQAAAVDRLLDDAGSSESVRGHGAVSVLTGGAANLIAGRLRFVRPLIEPHLTLTGLFLAARTL